NPAWTGGTTGTLRGYNVATATGSNSKFINNIITINAGGSREKHGIYITSGANIISNNNAFYISPGLANAHVGYSSTNQTTLANWQTLNSKAYDQNSVFAAPV